VSRSRHPQETAMGRCTGLLALWIAVLPWLAGREAQAEPRHDRCVILVTVGGLADFYLDDARAEMPTLRRLARQGARAQGMVCTFPTVTWPSHTSLVTGVAPAKHGVIGNNYFDRKTGKPVALVLDPLFDKDQVVKATTIYDAAQRAGLKTAAVVWPATRNARTLDWCLPDMSTTEAWDQYGTKSWLAELRAGGYAVDRQSAWFADKSGGGVQRDWLYVRMAAQVFDKHAPQLILVHLVEFNRTQHRCGPRSPDAYWCASYMDDRIRDLVEAVERSPRAAQTTLVICGDHGFLPARHEIRPNVVLRKLGLLEVAEGKINKQTAYCLPEGGACAVYVLDEKRPAEVVEQLQKALKNLDGVEAVLTLVDYARLGQPTPKEDPRAPDFWLAAKSGYRFSDVFTGDEVVFDHKAITGAHGYLPDQPDLLAACVLWGAGIKPGAELGKIDIADVAPTIAKLLGVELPGAEGYALRAALDLERKATVEHRGVSAGSGAKKGVPRPQAKP
jgi:predicted AlkP superfamily pyrophosphatase or phosphodiesterase